MNDSWRIPIALSVLACSGCAAHAGGGLTSLEWVLGDWVAHDGAITEQWQRVSDDTFEGHGVTRTGDKTSTESLRLVNMSGESYYIAKVSHNELPVAFRLAEDEDGRAVFVNPAHDFPKQIVYQRDGTDGMTVTVSDGGEKGFQIRFRKGDTGENP